MRDCWFEIVYGTTVFIYNAHPLQLMEKREINLKTNKGQYHKNNTDKNFIKILWAIITIIKLKFFIIMKFYSWIFLGN